MIFTFTGTWHNYYIVIEIWYSWTPVLLKLLHSWNSCTPELLYTWTPETGRLLILYFWYYTPVDLRNRITMNIGLLWMPCGHYHWTICNNWTTYTGMGETDEYRYNLHVYDGLKCRAATLLGFTWRPPSVFVGCTGTPYSPSFQVCHKPLGLFLWERWHPIQFKRTTSHGT